MWFKSYWPKSTILSHILAHVIWDKTGTDTATVPLASTNSAPLCIERPSYFFDIWYRFGDMCHRKGVILVHSGHIPGDVTCIADQLAIHQIAAICLVTLNQKENPTYLIQEKSCATLKMCAKRALAQMSVGRHRHAQST